MSNDTHAIRHSIRDLLNALHKNFGTNIATLPSDADPVLDDIDLNSRIISEIRALLSSNFCVSDAHKRICADILDEVFSDFSLAMYLCSIGLIVPARMSIRRAFELSLAAVYMWDLPHEYWGWREKDQDLSFSAMVSHLNSPGYIAYLAQQRPSTTASVICDQTNFQDIYRQLSNTVHGKVSGLPALSPERFASDKNGLEIQFRLMQKAQKLIIALLLGRFDGLEELLAKNFPQFKRV